MQRVSTLRTRQYGDNRLSTIIENGELIKNHEYFLEFKAKFEKPPYTDYVSTLGFLKKFEAKNLVGPSL
jgi:hypothetical protein